MIPIDMINKVSPDFKSRLKIPHGVRSIFPAQKLGMIPINRSGEIL